MLNDDRRVSSPQTKRDRDKIGFVLTCSLVLREAILMLPTSSPGDDPLLLEPTFFSAATWAAAALTASLSAVAWAAMIS